MKIESGSDASMSSSVSSCPSVSAASRSSRTIGDWVGLACLIASLLLMSMGVQTVKAEGETLMSIDPERVEEVREKVASKAKAESEARRKAQAALEAKGPGAPAVEIQPGVLVLNTRGYNYGPPPAAIDPAAMRVEKDLKPSR